MTTKTAKTAGPRRAGDARNRGSEPSAAAAPSAVRAVRPVRLVWPARARHETNDSAERKIWTTACGGYRVVRRKILYGGPTRDCRHPDVFRAERWCQYGTQSGWAALSSHKSLAAARRECERQAKIWARFEG